MGTYAEAKERYYKNLYKTDCSFEEWLRSNTDMYLDLCLFIKHPNKDGYFFNNFKETIGALALTMFKNYAELKVKNVFVITEGDSKKVHMYLE
jgi:hypothetical protein